MGGSDADIDILDSTGVSAGEVVDCVRLDESMVTMKLEALGTPDTESVLELVIGEDCAISVAIGCGNVAEEKVLEVSMLSVVRRPGVNSVSDIT